MLGLRRQSHKGQAFEESGQHLLWMSSHESRQITGFRPDF